MIKKQIIIIGSGSHSKVVYDCLKLSNKEIVGAIDNNYIKGEKIYADLICLGNDEIVEETLLYCLYVNGIGSVINTEKRKNIFETYKKKKCIFFNVIHPSAIISNTVKLKEGVQILAGVILQPNVTINDNSIINTGVKIDHDCVIGKHVHLAPGVTLSGNVSIGDNTHIGTGCNVIQNINIGKDCSIGAGITILKDIPSNTFLSPKETLVWK